MRITWESTCRMKVELRGQVNLGLGHARRNSLYKKSSPRVGFTVSDPVACRIRREFNGHKKLFTYTTIPGVTNFLEVGAEGCGGLQAAVVLGGSPPGQTVQLRFV